MANPNPGSKQHAWKKPAFKIYSWFGLIVGFGLSPFILVILYAAVIRNSSFSLIPTIIHGELLVLSIALFGDTLHEHFNQNPAQSHQVDRYGQSIAIACIVCLVGLCFMLAIIFQQDMKIRDETDKVMSIFTTHQFATKDLSVKDLKDLKGLANALGSLNTDEDQLNQGLVVVCSILALVLSVGAGIAIRWKGE